MGDVEGAKEPACTEYVEVDPTGRYGRYKELLGKGATKAVYSAFDEQKGIEVAWNQVRLYDFLQSPDDLERLYCEIHLLKTLKHRNIMEFHASWVDVSRRNVNFITELFTSGTLRQYRQKHRKVDIRAVKHWCRQILSALEYLHSHDPPIIHRDLKCDNIFINGHQGEVKIGDLGLAAILRKSHAENCVGTPEFMAPEVYAEKYNELVDIYSFGMCVLEMVTLEYPYGECTHPAQIYKKVTNGTMPDALCKVDDPAVRMFVMKCLAPSAERPSARELLMDQFLLFDDSLYCSGEYDFGSLEFPLQNEPSFSLVHSNGSSAINGNWTCNDVEHDDIPVYGLELFNGHEDEPLSNLGISIKGKKKQDGSIFLRLRIADLDGCVRNIHFPFNIDSDSAFSVAFEMVAVLDIMDHEVTQIADMIDGEVSRLVPEWKSDSCIDETGTSSAVFCENCASSVSSTGSTADYTASALHVCQCAAYGRFEEITIQTLDDQEPEGTLISTRNQEQPEHREVAKLKKVFHQPPDFSTRNAAAAAGEKGTGVSCHKLESFHVSTRNNFHIRWNEASEGQ